MRYHVMRQDDNGVDAFISCWSSPEAALAEQVRLESSKHKQFYWMQPTTVCNHKDASPS